MKPNTAREEHASKIVSLMSEYCLCQRVKPPSDPKSPFTSDADYIAALQVRAINMVEISWSFLQSRSSRPCIYTFLYMFCMIIHV